MRRFDTVKPTSPALGLAPTPVAPSSRISPPDPVAAPGNGAIAVGWLCVSTFIRIACVLAVRAVAAVVARIEALDGRALDHRRVVGVGDERSLRMRGVRRADHREQALVLRHAVDDPVGVEDLVAAVLGVRLREHHQLDVGRIAAERAEAASR